MDVTTASSFSTFYHWDIFADSAGCQPAFDFNCTCPGGTRVELSTGFNLHVDRLASVQEKLSCDEHDAGFVSLVHELILQDRHILGG